MTADEWLQANGKAPWQCPYNDSRTGDDDPFWFWSNYVSTEDEIDPDELDYTLPLAVWEHLQARTTYPDVKMYLTRHEAMEDFRQAFGRTPGFGRAS